MEENKTWMRIPEDGDMAIPANILAQSGLKAGDEIGFVVTDSGIIMGSREQISDQLLDQIGAALRKANPDKSDDDLLDMLMQRGRDTIRPQLLKDLYNIEADE